jgi:hypothetical protein
MIRLVQEQAELFNRDAPEEEKVALLERIRKRQAELKDQNKS